MYQPSLKPSSVSRTSTRSPFSRVSSSTVRREKACTATSMIEDYGQEEAWKKKTKARESQACVAVTPATVPECYKP